MMHRCLLSFFVCCSLFLHAGPQQKTDSLLAVISSSSSHDTSKVSARFQYGEAVPVMRIGYWDSLCNDCAKLSEAAMHPAVKTSLQRTHAQSLNNLGYCVKESGNPVKGITHYLAALALFEVLGDQAGIAGCSNNLGLVYYNFGDIPQALKYYERALRIRESLNDHQGIGNTYNNLGLLYHSQHDTVRALEYYRKSMYQRSLVGDHKGVAQGLNNIGVIHDDYGNYDSTRYYYTLSLKVCRENKNAKGTFTALSNLANLLKVHGHADTALLYYRESLALRVQYGSQSHIAKCQASIADVFYELGNTDSALYYGLKSLETAQQLDYPENIADAAEVLTKIYERQGNGMKALEMHRLYITNRDRISNEASQQATARQLAQYEYEKQKILDDAQHANDLAVEEQKQAKQRTVIFAVAAGLLLVAAFLLFVINRLRLTRKQKQIIEEQKNTVELAHAELEDKNTAILDSITYARIIQNAILPSEKTIRTVLPEHFVLYKPKDIVAGDFYWLEKRGTVTLFAVADCTGHGVPGALISVFCHNALNRSVREYGLTDPGRVLERTREIVMEEFRKNEDEVHDGMDISLCALSGNQLQWAGANNGLWIVRNGELTEYKPDKQPISIYEEYKPFTTHSIALEPGDHLYLYSDGYADQFGGERGKKFKASNLKLLLAANSTRSMADQRAILDATLESWRGNIEQIDDICVWGVRV
jgi:serine phosphatase RsbU (regulator of sigma subunit)